MHLNHFKLANIGLTYVGLPLAMPWYIGHSIGASAQLGDRCGNA
jgi:hypothetical protein